MRNFILTVLVFVGANALSQEFIDKVTEELIAVSSKCAEKVGASTDDIAELTEHKIPPTTHEAKCVIACIYDHYKIFNSDGTVNKQNSIDAVNDLKAEDPDLYTKVLEIINVCETKIKIFDDKCETASGVASCIVIESQLRGITKETFMRK